MKLSCYLAFNIRDRSSTPLLVSKEVTEWCVPSDETEKNRGPVSQHVWHDKDPFLFKGPERRV
jgi:hypothetical protein